VRRSNGIGGDRNAPLRPLSAAQRSTVWNDLSKQETNQNAAGFHAKIGASVPNAVKLKPIPSKMSADVPSLRPYDFAMVGHKLVIVDPSNRVIANVLKGEQAGRPNRFAS
jgi:Protein of unknown function (DUF1236)